MKYKIEVDADQTYISPSTVRCALMLLARLYSGEIPERLVWRTCPQQDTMIKLMSQEVDWTLGNKEFVRTLGGISLQVELGRPKDVISLESEDKNKTYLEIKNLRLAPRLQGNASDAIQEDVAQYVQKMSFKDGDILFVDADAVDAMELSKSFPIQKGRVSIVPLVVPHGKILAECIEKREADHV